MNTVKWTLPSLLMLLGLGSCLPMSMGCTFRLKDNGELGFKMNNEFAFYHQTSETKSVSEASTDFPSAEAWIFSNAKVAEDEAADDDDADDALPPGVTTDPGVPAGTIGTGTGGTPPGQ